MNLLVSLRSEMLKTKRTASFYLTLIGAAIVPVVFLLNVMLDGLEDVKKDPLNNIFKLEAEMNGFAFFPWFIILICTLLPQLEYKNNTWKQVLSSPQTKGNLLLAKFLNIHLLLLLFMVATHLFLFLALITANLVFPDLGLFNYTLDGRRVLVNAGNTYLVMLALGTIQFWLGLRFKNFIVPIGIGLALWLTGTMMVFEFNSSMARYFPYSYQVFSLSPKHRPYLNQIAWTSAGYAIVFLGLCFLDFRKREFNK